MIINLFRVFDPATRNTLSLNWIRSALFLTLIPIPFWFRPSRYYILFKIIEIIIFKEFKVISSYCFSNIILFTSTFIFIAINNFIGLFPYIFTASSHITFSLSLSLSMWLGIIIYRLTNFFNDTMAHLTPLGTPPILIPFIVIIESIRIIIRPLTLAIRLTANIIAGHLLLTLLGNSGEIINSYPILIIIIIRQTALFILELSVSIIQAYVFSVLIVLYRREC